jgi:hypothetical protein
MRHPACVHPLSFAGCTHGTSVLGTAHAAPHGGSWPGWVRGDAHRPYQPGRADAIAARERPTVICTSQKQKTVTTKTDASAVQRRDLHDKKSAAAATASCSSGQHLHRSASARALTRAHPRAATDGDDVVFVVAMLVLLSLCSSAVAVVFVRKYTKRLRRRFPIPGLRREEVPDFQSYVLWLVLVV